MSIQGQLCTVQRLVTAGSPWRWYMSYVLAGLGVFRTCLNETRSKAAGGDGFSGVDAAPMSQTGREL